jgi:hypothetical protein
VTRARNLIRAALTLANGDGPEAARLIEARLAGMTLEQVGEVMTELLRDDEVMMMDALPHLPVIQRATSEAEALAAGDPARAAAIVQEYFDAQENPTANAARSREVIEFLEGPFARALTRVLQQELEQW